MAENLISDNRKTKAEELKAEGNVLFIKKHFRKAYAKYTGAINLDNTNAVLYANRACYRFLSYRLTCIDGSLDTLMLLIQRHGDV